MATRKKLTVDEIMAAKMKIVAAQYKPPEHKIEINYGKDAVYTSTEIGIDGQENRVVKAGAPLSFIEGKLLEYIKTFVTKPNIPILLPQGIRYYESNEEHQAFLIELPPAVYTLHYDTIIDAVLNGTYIRGDGDRPFPKAYKDVDVAIPWQYFWVKFKTVPNNDYGITHSMEDAYLFWAQERITSIGSRVYPARLPNINSKTGKICLGDVFPSSQIPPLERTEEIVNLFYESKFNDDYPIKIPYASFEDWVKATKLNPYAWVNWEQDNYYLSRLIVFDKPKQASFENIGTLFSLLNTWIHEYSEEAVRFYPMETSTIISSNSNANNYFTGDLSGLSISRRPWSFEEISSVVREGEHPEIDALEEEISPAPPITERNPDDNIS